MRCLFVSDRRVLGASRPGPGRLDVGGRRHRQGRHARASRRGTCPVPQSSPMRGDDVLYLKGHGLSASTARTPSRRTRFFRWPPVLAFTTTAIAMLVDDGKMSWDDPVRKHPVWAFHLGESLADRDVTCDLALPLYGPAQPRPVVVSRPVVAGGKRLPRSGCCRSTSRFAPACSIKAPCSPPRASPLATRPASRGSRSSASAFAIRSN